MPLRLGVDPRFRNRERQPGLDLLRALAIIVVVVLLRRAFRVETPELNRPLRLDRCRFYAASDFVPVVFRVRGRF